MHNHPALLLKKELFYFSCLASSLLFLQENIDSLSLVEPSKMYESLTVNVVQINNETHLDFYKSVFSEVATEICEKQKPDSIIYVNVLEHIEDDCLELFGG